MIKNQEAEVKEIKQRGFEEKKWKARQDLIQKILQENETRI